MLAELLLSMSLFQTCPGTTYRYCGDKTPESYTQFVWHHGNHDDGQNRTSPFTEAPSRPDRPSPAPDPTPEPDPAICE